MQPEKILALDLDDTIIDSEKAYEDSLHEVGIDPKAEIYLQSRATAKDKLPPGSPSSRNRFLYFKVLLENSGHYSAQKHLELYQNYQEALFQHIKNQVVQLDRMSLLKRMRSDFQKIIIITNETTLTQILKLNAIDPNGDLIDSIVTSEEIGFEKPDLRIFNFAIQKLKCSPQQITFIGDSFTNDIEPALKLGMKAIKTIEFKNDKHTSSLYPTIDKLEDYKRLI